MTEQTKTILDIQQAIAAQDTMLRAAYRAFAARSDGFIHLPTAIVERLAEVCHASPARRVPLRPERGIRC
jgi:hypothetical protein